MRVLWFSPTPGLYETRGKRENIYFGGGWVSSLQNLFKNKNEYQIAICFFHRSDSRKITNNNFTYYPICRGNKLYNAIKRGFFYLLNRNIDDSFVEEFKMVVKDFQPDLIQCFGTELSYGHIQSHVDVPVIFHIQGVLDIYYKKYFEDNLSIFDSLFHMNFIARTLLLRSYFFDYLSMKLRAKRETNFLRHAKYIFGRTEFDREHTKFQNLNAEYFHINEVLRPQFYISSSFKPKIEDPVKIFTTISPSPYKGIDFIVKSAKFFLKNKIKIDWRIAGIPADHSLINYFLNRNSITAGELGITFIGYQNPDLIKLEIEKANFYVHPSLIENSPNSVCEAQILGLPVIARNTGGIPSLIKHGETGMLIDEYDYSGVFSSIFALQHDEVLYNRISFKSKAIASERHNPSEILNSLEKAYKIIFLKNKK